MKFSIAFVLALSTFDAGAIPLSLSISDPLGDNTDTIDLVSIQMSFDNATGDYDIFYNAHAANPFLGFFRINVNLRNITLLGVPPRAPDFSDTLNDFDLALAATQVQLSGNSSALLAWSAGDEIAYILPGAGGFATSGFRGDSLGPSGAGDPMLTTFVTGIPEPTTLALLGIGLAGIGYSKKRAV
jgi:PEP-CTERM motif